MEYDPETIAWLRRCWGPNWNPPTVEESGDLNSLLANSNGLEEEANNDWLYLYGGNDAA